MFRNRILQDLPLVLTQRSLQTLEATSFHTAPTKNRKFWNLFEFSRKDNRKDAKKLSKQGDALKASKNTKLSDPSKSLFTMKISNKAYSNAEALNNDYTFRYIPRVKPKNKLSRTNINKPDELTSLLDGNLVPTNMKLKLKGYKTLRNAQAKDFAFVPGGKCFELDILPSQNEDGSIDVSYKLSETIPPKKVEKSKKLSPQETSYNELESHYVPFPIPMSDYSTYTEEKVSTNKTNTNDPEKIINKETHESRSNPAKNTLKQSETTAAIKEDTPAEQEKSLTQSHGQDNSQLQNDFKQESLSQKDVQSPETVMETTQPLSNVSNQNEVEPSPLTSTNQPGIQDNVSESRDTAEVGQFTSSDIVPNRTSPYKTSHDSSVKKMDKDNPDETTESEKISSNKMSRHSMYESKMEQQRRASSPCSTSFVRTRENSTKQRWSGFDRPATGCCPGSSGSHGTRSQGSTRPYPPTVPTREASSKCYARERDPIVRSNIARSGKMVKTRNSVTAASIATVNFAEASTRVKGERILLGSKSATGLVKISQTVAYGSCNKSSSSCNEKNACVKKRRGNCEEEEMIPGKIICTKPRRRNDCSRPKPCRVEKPCERKFSCAEKPPPPRPSCVTKPKKKKICKRYCCPSLQEDDCLLKRHTCPPKRGKKCSNVNEDDDDYDRPEHEDYYQRAAPKDPTCLPNECSNKTEGDNCGPIREICTNPRRCNKSRSCNREEKDDDCLENEPEYREICTKPRRKECCNSRRNSRRSNSCGNRRYHSETKPLRSSKSFVTIPMFDVSVVSLRPYQNDAVLRFYSCGQKPPACGQKEDPCKKKCQRPEPKCLNKSKNTSPCGPIQDDKCSRMMKQSVCGKSKDDPCAKFRANPCGKPKADPCQPKPDPCRPQPDPCRPQPDPCRPKADPCQSSRSTQEDDKARLQRELREVQQCKSKSKGQKCKTEKRDPCQKKDKCNFESINDSEVFNTGFSGFRVKLDDPLIDFWLKRGYDASLLNFGMKPDNIIVNRSFCTMRKTDRRYENTLQLDDKEESPALIKAQPRETEWDEESSASKW